MRDEGGRKTEGSISVSSPFSSLIPHPSSLVPSGVAHVEPCLANQRVQRPAVPEFPAPAGAAGLARQRPAARGGGDYLGTGPTMEPVVGALHHPSRVVSSRPGRQRGRLLGGSTARRILVRRAGDGGPRRRRPCPGVDPRARH